MPLDPTNLDSFNHKSARLSTGRTYHYVDQLPTDYDVNKTVTLLLIHGFPELWAAWKYQIGPWVEAGYRVVVPDMLGFGQTDKPDDPEEYSPNRLSDDLSALLDHVDSAKAVLIGHDWGSVVAARFVLRHPQRALSVAHLSIGFPTPLVGYVSLEELVRDFPMYSYQLYFAHPETDKKIADHIEVFYRLVFAVPSVTAGNFGNFTRILDGEVQVDPGVIKTILTDEEVTYYITQNASFRGPLNYYRTTRIRFEEVKAGDLPMAYPANIPVLFLRGIADPTSPETQIAAMKKVLPQARIINYEGAGHWLMIQKKDDVTKDVLSWLSDSSPIT